MDKDNGFSNLHFVIAGVFALTLALGTFATVSAMTSMSSGEMSEVTGQEGIKMDIHLSSTFQASALWTDGDGAAAAGNTTGTVGIHGITPAGSGTLDLTGLTIDADGSTQVGASSGGAIVIGVPNLGNGIAINDIDPGGAGTSDFATTSGTSIGSFKVGGISASNSRIEIAAN